MRPLLILLPALLLVACASRPQSPPATPFIRGTAKVISVDPGLGHALLQIGNRQVDAYWQTEVAAAQGGSTIQPDANKPPVGIYREPQVRNPAFTAQPGDTIAFVGLQTGNSIFLSGISVVGP